MRLKAMVLKVTVLKYDEVLAKSSIQEIMKLKSKMNIGLLWNERSIGDRGERRRLFEGD
jgi:hypothetical protein